MMKSYCQRDPLWAQNKLGQSGLTIGRYGCTTSCIADLASYFGEGPLFTPLTVAKAVQYTIDGRIIWKSCSFPHFKFWFREYGRNDTNISNALKDPDIAVILEVAHSHWVVATSKQFSGVYNIADPWFGDRSDMRRYGDQITGAAYFKRS